MRWRERRRRVHRRPSAARDAETSQGKQVPIRVPWYHRLRLSTAMAITVSDAGLGLYAFVFTALSIVVRGVFDACNVANLPPIAEAGLTREDCEQWSQSWIKNAPRGKESAAELLVLFFHVLVRIEQNFFLCSSIACWYALFKCTAVQRKPMHLFLALVPHRTRRLRASRSASAPPRSCGFSSACSTRPPGSSRRRRHAEPVVSKGGP